MKLKQFEMKIITIALIAIRLSTAAIAQDIEYYSPAGTAIKGYDPVAYFVQNKAVMGSDKYTVEWSGSLWKFISQSDLDSFKLAPEKYAPQYGGYCAYGASENHKAPTDPNAWTIVNNKLYLNYDSKVKEYWIKDTTARIKTADNLWPELIKENSSIKK
jgi:hypothetical protein